MVDAALELPRTTGAVGVMVSVVAGIDHAGSFEARHRPHSSA